MLTLSEPELVNTFEHANLLHPEWEGYNRNGPIRGSSKEQSVILVETFQFKIIIMPINVFVQSG